MNILDTFKSAIITQGNPVVFELGACDGTHTLQMVEMLEATGRPYRYFAFEPVVAEGDMIAGAQRMLANTDWLYTKCDGGLYEGDITAPEMLALLPGFRSLGRCQDGNLILRNEILT